MRPLKLFVSHSFTDKHHTEGLSGFRNGIARVVHEVQRQLPPDVRLDVVFSSDRYGTALFPEIRSEVLGADIALSCLSGLRPNVLIETGLRLATDDPPIVIADRGHWDVTSIPSELSHLLIGDYEGSDELLRVLMGPLRDRALLALDRVRTGASREGWFGDSVADINVVCSPEPERSSFARRDHRNYLFIDNLEDRDALVEILVFASRMYPTASVTRHCSANVGPDILKRSLIVVGGPGLEASEGNAVAREVMASCGLGVRYGLQEDYVEFRGQRYAPVVRPSGEVARDFGYIARVRNPLNSEAWIVLAQGMFTYGTLGACLALSDQPDARSNHYWLREKVGDLADAEFEALVEVTVGPGGVVTAASAPLVRAERIWRP